MDNILVDSNYNLKLIDFGFATLAPKGKLRLFCGTPSYMSPELVQKKEYKGGPADVWATGVVMFALCTGKFPFKSPIERELYRKITKGMYQYPTNISNGAKRIIDKMLTSDPNKRPSAETLKNDPYFLSGTSTAAGTSNSSSVYAPSVDGWA